MFKKYFPNIYRQLVIHHITVLKNGETNKYEVLKFDEEDENFEGCKIPVNIVSFDGLHLMNYKERKIN